jgi:hypothetical protein
MAGEPIFIELLNSLDRVHANEPVPLHLLIRCSDVESAELRQIGCLKPNAAELDTDLFERDLVIRKGEIYRCVVSARFRETGTHPDPLFFVQVGRDKESRRVRVPTPPLRVVPSLLDEIEIRAESICTYEYGTKVDVTLSHRGSTRFEDFRLSLGPAESIQAGVSDQRRPLFEKGQQVRFTTVTDAGHIQLTLDARVGSEQVGPVSFTLAVPPVRDTATTAPFRFLEPKKLSQADIQISTLDEARTKVLPHSGIHDVYGNGTKYRIEIRPAHPHVSAVKLRGVSGSVEVTEMPSDTGSWAFQMVVLTSNVLTTSVGLHYDVTTPEGPQQGEVNLAIRPSSTKLWLVAATAGCALTVKGVAAAMPAIVNPGEYWDVLSEGVTHIHQVWDLLQFLSIPLLRFALWIIDSVVRIMQE